MNTNIRDVSFFTRRGGGSEDFRGGTPFFPNLKRGGARFFPEFNIKYFFKKGMQYKKSECKLYY